MIIKLRIVLILVIHLALVGCTDREYSEKRVLMGTIFEIKVYCKNSKKAKDSIDAAFKDIDRMENLFSVYKPESDVSVLNATGVYQVSEEVMELTKLSVHYSSITGGAFDITVLPLISMWKSASKSGKIPSDSEVEECMKLVGSGKINIDEKNQKIYFPKRGMKIDFGGIAKGYAVDRAVKLLKQNGIHTGLVNAGGNIAVFGSREWRISVRNPDKTGDDITVLTMRDLSVATSGDYERYFFLDKKKISHIINPFTGYPAEGVLSVTVVTENPASADVLSTAVFVLGPVKGVELIEKLCNAECLVIDGKGVIYRSAGFSDYE